MHIVIIQWHSSGTSALDNKNMEDTGFFAHSFVIIDAVPKNELQTGSRIYENIQDYINQSGTTVLSSKRIRCNTPSDLIKALDEVLDSLENGGQIPFIHLDSHGDRDNIRLPNGSSLGWDVIFDQFRKINIASRNNLFVASSACESAYAYKAAAHITKECPVLGLFAPAMIVSAGEVQDGFDAFYKNLLLEHNLQKASNAFKDATNSKRFVPISSQTLFVKVAFYYLTKHCMGAGRRRGQEELLTIVKQKTNIPLNKETRKKVKEFKKSQAVNLCRFHKKFMMIDKYPENAERFVFDAVKFEEEVRSGISEDTLLNSYAGLKPESLH